MINQTIDEAAFLGFNGYPMPDEFNDDDLLSCAWDIGRRQAIDKGLIQPVQESFKSIRIIQDPSIQMDSFRVPHSY